MGSPRRLHAPTGLGRVYVFCPTIAGPEEAHSGWEAGRCHPAPKRHPRMPNIVCMIVTSNAIVREQRRLDITPASPDRKKSLALMDGTVPAMAVLRTVCGTALCCVGGDGACVKYYPFT